MLCRLQAALEYFHLICSTTKYFSFWDEKTKTQSGYLTKSFNAREEMKIFEWLSC